MLAQIHLAILDTIRRRKRCEMDELMAETEIARMLEGEITIADLRQAIARLEQLGLIRDYAPGGSPLWTITPAGLHMLPVRAAPRGCSSPANPGRPLPIPATGHRPLATGHRPPPEYPAA